VKLLVMTEEGRQKLREKQQQRESKRRPGLTLEEVLAAMTEVDLEEMENGARELSGPGLYLAGFHEAIVSLLAHIKEGKE